MGNRERVLEIVNREIKEGITPKELDYIRGLLDTAREADLIGIDERQRLINRAEYAAIQNKIL